MKFARAATGRPRIVSLKSSYHGLSYGALSITGSETFQEGFGPFLADTEMVKLGDLAALEATLSQRDVAAFIIEPVQGKGVNYPTDDYFQRAQALCRAHGTLLICDEVQTGLGRTGKWFAFEHWGLEPDIVTLAKTLSGGYVPCGAIVTRRRIYQKVFSRLDRCVVHSSTFGRNNLAMTCAMASLSVLEDEHLIENSARMGALLMQRITALKARHPFIKEVRGKGLMIAIEFHEPPQFKSKLAWRLMHKIDQSLFPQLVIVPMLSKHRILTQVAGHNMDVIKILPPLTIGEREVDYFVHALDETLTECSRFPGPIMELAKNTARLQFRRNGVKAPKKKRQESQWAQRTQWPSSGEWPSIAAGRAEGLMGFAPRGNSGVSSEVGQGTPTANEPCAIVLTGRGTTPTTPANKLAGTPLRNRGTRASAEDDSFAGTGRSTAVPTGEHPRSQPCGSRQRQLVRDNYHQPKNMKFATGKGLLTILAALAVCARLQAVEYDWNNSASNFNAAGSYSAPGGGAVETTALSTTTAAYFRTVTIQPSLTAAITIAGVNLPVSGFDLMAATTGYGLTLSGYGTSSTGTSASSEAAVYSTGTGTNTFDVPVVLASSSGTSASTIYQTGAGGTLTFNGIISGTNGPRHQSRGDLDDQFQCRQHLQRGHHADRNEC